MTVQAKNIHATITVHFATLAAHLMLRHTDFVVAALTMVLLGGCY
jgi:hypothetical protein